MTAGQLRDLADMMDAEAGKIPAAAREPEAENAGSLA